MICCTVVMLSPSARLHCFLRAQYNKVENGLMGENNMAIGFFVPLVCFIVVAAFAETLSENKGALARKDSFSNQSGSVN